MTWSLKQRLNLKDRTCLARDLLALRMNLASMHLNHTGIMTSTSNNMILDTIMTDMLKNILINPEND